MSARRRGGTIALVLAFLVVLLPTLSGGAAHAVTTVVTTNYRCVTSAFGVSFEDTARDYDVSILAPTSAEAGSTAVVRWQLGQAVRSLPFALTGVSTITRAAFDVTVNNGAPSPIEVTSSTSAVSDVAARGALPMDRSLRFVLPVTGSVGDVVRIRPRTITVTFVTGDDLITGAEVVPVEQVCDPTAPPATSAELTVRAATPPDPDNPCVVISGACVSTANGGSAGDLRQDVRAAGPNPNYFTVDLGSVTSSSTTTTLSAPMNTVRVTDLRTDPFGWTLTARLDVPLIEGGGATMPASALRVGSIDCAEAPGASGSAPPDAGAGGTLDEAVALCSVQPGSTGPGGTGAGQYDVSGTLTLTTPAFQKAGDYVGVLELNLS